MSNHPPATSTDWPFVGRVIVKAVFLFVLLNVIYALLNPLSAIGKMSIYNSLVPGRARLPFGETPDQSYNLSLFQLDAMFASHKVSMPKAANEYWVLLVGDSSVWGILLRPDETLAGQINALSLITDDGKSVRAYNLGYPTISVTKDLLILSRIGGYQPDLIIWLVTLEALPAGKQLSSPIVQHNTDEMRSLIQSTGLDMDTHDPAFVDAGFMDKTIVGQRRELADVLRLNLYGVMWAATGIDQIYPEDYTPLQKDFEPDDSFADLRPPLTIDDLAFDVLAAGIDLVGNVPVVLVNEPMFIGSGKNSDIRYNFYYPRWAYDDYRTLLASEADRQGWHYLDLWDAVSPTEYTNSAIHLTPKGESQLAELIGEAIINQQE
ncbi:MAG: hypothetical protein JXB07_16385 [Anaerolineae bacterium]|nr:hypothetical protein [Anaerolineae bacterium]